MDDGLTMRVLRIGKQIQQAIEKQQRLRFVYGNQERTVDPYLFGVSRKNKLILSAYQLQSGWRTFDMSDVEKVEVLGEHYQMIDSYNPDDPNFKEILCRI